MTMALLRLVSPLVYESALTNLPQSMPKRCVSIAKARSSGEAAATPRAIPRRSANYEPSLWDHHYILSLDNKYAKEDQVKETWKRLKEDVMKMLEEAEGSLKQLEFIDTLQRLGTSYHFEPRINYILAKIFDENVKRCWNNRRKEDLHAIALEFRLLRQHGFDVPNDIFDKFKDEFETDLNEDAIKVLLCYYEASYLWTTELDISKVKEARSFARDGLRKFVAKNKGKKEEKSYTEEMVIRALELPFHWNITRLEARWYVNVYRKRDDMNPALLQFAKLDFNIVQAVHQDELKHVSSWWRKLGLGRQLDFIRDRVTENYLWAVGIIHDPEFGYHRRIIAKVNALVTTIDDIYDIYGTLEELRLFTAAVEKWDVNHLEELPEQMRMCFLVLHNEINQIGCDVLRDKRFNVIPYLKNAWTDLCKAYLIEAEWYANGYKPSLSEYMQNAWISISIPAVLLHIFCILSDQISPQTLTFLSNCHQPLLRCSATIFRLANDLGTSPEEMARGDVPKSIQCYMHETGASEAEARAHVMNMMSDLWGDFNYHIQTARCSSLPRRFVDAAVNLVRMSQCMYQYGDGHGHPAKAKTVDRVLSLLVNPLPPY